MARLDLLVEAGVDQVWVHAGAAGSLLAQRDGSRHWLPPVPAHRVVDVTGAGDAALAGYCHALLSGADPVSAARFGHATASAANCGRHVTPTGSGPQSSRSALRCVAARRLAWIATRTSASA